MTREEFIAKLKEFDLTPHVIAGIVDVSVSTAQRWLDGRNVPHELMRPGIIKALIEDQE